MFRLHSAQSSLLKYHQHNPDAVNHYHCIATDLIGELNVATLQKAFSKVVQRHDMLRSAVVYKGDKPEIVTSQPQENSAPIILLDASLLNAKPLAQLKDTLNALNAQDFLDKPFNMEKGPLWRAALIKTAENQHQLIILCDPLIVDDKSLHILLSEIQIHYNSDIANNILELPTAKQHRETLNDNEENARLQQWKSNLADLNVIQLQTSKSETGSTKFRGKQMPFNLDSNLVSTLKASMPEYSIEQILLTTLYTLLHRYTGEKDITIGNTVNNREPEENQINACANWAAMRQKIISDQKFSDLLSDVKYTQLEAHSALMPIDKIYETSLSESTLSSLRTIAPFDILLTVNNSVPAFHLTNTAPSQPMKIDLGYNPLYYFHMTVNQLDDGTCDNTINFNTDLFDDKTIESLLGHFDKILRTVAINSDCRMSDIPLPLDPEVKLISEYNATSSNSHFESMQTPAAFSAIAKLTPTETAVVFHNMIDEPQRMSYQELEIYSNQIANYLRETCQLKTGDRVALSITRSINLAAFILGALKAGLIIVPLETTADNSLEYKFATAKSSLVITDNQTKNLFEDKKTQILNIDDATVSHCIKVTDDTFYPPAITANSPAYIMYSSGTTTGIPKASLLTHGGLTNLLNALVDQKYPQHLKVLCTALPTFDAFLFDFLAAWSSNGCVHLTTDEKRYSPQAVEDIIRKEDINFAVFLPDLMGQLPPDLRLKITITMGASPNESTLESWLTAYPERKILNGLGHTETGICLSLQTYTPGANTDLVGRPISNMQMFVLDPVYRTLCPPGVPGEIYVAGPGLASEYVGNADLTQSKFLTMRYLPDLHKFTSCSDDTPGAIKLYASGDFGCYQQTENDGLSIKCIGRTDRRIKLYGVSIDLDGVEAAISKLPQVQSVAVVLNKNKTALIAYVVMTKQTFASDTRELLRTHLKTTTLPKVAFPQFVLMKSLPKNANGKISYKELPAAPDRSLLKPRHNQQLIPALISIWRDVLGNFDTDDIDLNTPFADLGGNSLLLAALEIKINKELPLTQRIGVGQQYLSKSMTINSLADALRPILTKSQSTQQPTLGNVTGNYRGNKLVLFPNRTQTATVNYYDTPTNLSNQTNDSSLRK